jgi:hypothetical protein
VSREEEEEKGGGASCSDNNSSRGPFDKFEKEFSLVTLVSSVGSVGFVRDNRWIIDNGASCHIIGIWRIFLSITETGPDWLVESEGGIA